MNLKILHFVAKFDISSPIVLKRDEVVNNVLFTVPEENVYTMANIRLRVSYSRKRLIKIIKGNQNFKEYDESILYVAVGDEIKEFNFEMAIRVLETLAYGFNDYRARESMCGYYKFLAK